MSAKFRELISSERGHVLIEPLSVKHVLKDFWSKLTGKKTASVSPNASADGPPLLTPNEKPPVTGPSGKSVGAGAAHEFHRFTDYSEPMLINRGGHGADAVFKQSFESRVSPEFTNGGQMLVRYMAENKIDTVNGRQLTPHDLNTLASDVSSRIMTSPERSNSFVKDGNGNKLIEVWDETSQGGMLFTKTGEFVEFVGNIRLGNESALLPPARAGPQSVQIEVSEISSPRRISDEAAQRVIKQAQQWQGRGDYPGIDQYRAITLKKGTRILGGEPGQTEFYTTMTTMKRFGNDAQKIFEAMQVKPKDGVRYRPGLTEYEVTNDVVVAIGITKNNPQWGPGTAIQIFVNDFGNVLKPVKTHLLKNWRIK